jgi:hypothetical protein
MTNTEKVRALEDPYETVRVALELLSDDPRIPAIAALDSILAELQETKEALTLAKEESK